MLYKVGDRVKIKSWDRMVEEFGYDESYEGEEVIQCEGGFIPSMKYLCEGSYTIVEALDGYGYILENEDKWEISDDMIEGKVEEIDLKEYDDAIRDIYQNWNDDKVKKVFGVETFSSVYVGGVIVKHGLKKMLELYKQEKNNTKIVVGDILYSKKVDKEMVVTAIREYDHAVNYVGVGRWNGEMCIWSKEGLEKRGHIDLGEIING